MSKLIIEICPKEPRATACLIDGREVSEDPEVYQDLLDCNRSGDCEPACLYILDNVGVEFRIVACTKSGNYRNRLATAKEKLATASAIYFDSSGRFQRRKNRGNLPCMGSGQSSGE